ncbi:hypothetical protein BH11VER1_BH11VER1_13620 [soil metagenome]
MKQLENRWQEDAGKNFLDRLTLGGRSGNGFSVSESPFGMTTDGRLDLRGLRLAEKTELRKVTFSPSDLGAASWKGIWLERCTFNESSFVGAGFQKIAEHGNIFTNCTFLKSSFREAAIGYRGSRFENCTFDGVDFSRAVFVRPEFDGCEFHHCKLDGCDLNGSSFERCRFVGTLRGVWFRGGFAHPNDLSRHGHPRPNRMAEVSFESAALRDVTFSNGCDLSSVRPPNDGHHVLVAQWSEKLQNLQNQSFSWSENQRKAASAFASTNLVHARTQDWFILNRDDLETEFGDDISGRIWQAITAPTDSERPPSSRD